MKLHKVKIESYTLKGQVYEKEESWKYLTLNDAVELCYARFMEIADNHEIFDVNGEPLTIDININDVDDWFEWFCDHEQQISINFLPFLPFLPSFSNLSHFQMFFFRYFSFFSNYLK